MHLSSISSPYIRLSRLPDPGSYLTLGTMKVDLECPGHNHSVRVYVQNCPRWYWTWTVWASNTILYNHHSVSDAESESLQYRIMSFYDCARLIIVAVAGTLICLTCLGSLQSIISPKSHNSSSQIYNLYIQPLQPNP